MCQWFSDTIDSYEVLYSVYADNCCLEDLFRQVTNGAMDDEDSAKICVKCSKIVNSNWFDANLSDDVGLLVND